MQASPPLGALHLFGRRTLHLVVPSARVRQHVAVPGFPHVDLAAARIRSRLHCVGRLPAAMAALPTRTTQRTYCPWFRASEQGHCSSAAARVAATASASPDISPHAGPPSWACTARGGACTIASARSAESGNARWMDRMCTSSFVWPLEPELRRFPEQLTCSAESPKKTTERTRHRRARFRSSDT